MENASKALIMAASVLLGVMIITIGVYLYSIFGDYSSQISYNLAQKEINEFNSQFTKYLSYKDLSGNWQNLCRAHDVVTMANLAKQNNYNYEYSDGATSESYYISVKVNVGNATYNSNNFETKSESFYSDFIKNYSLIAGSTEPYYFRCTEIKISETTKLVKQITIELN